jgi:Holliday junction resolvase YEN1
MGITDLWSILAPGFDPRIPFPIFVSEFINKYGRTPRIAIDAYMFIFQSNHSNLQGAEVENDIQVRNIMSKLMYLTLLSVSYVVVFDGRYKPQKLRHNEDVYHCISYDDQLNGFKKISFKNENYIEDSLCTPLINRLIEIFRVNKIDFIQSPGEAEAECAMLQKFGVVDFVLTKDTDVFVFGATKVLRNFSRSEQDLSVSSTSNAVKDYYVTPVDMTKVAKETGLDYQRLILVATLRGGDYSNGMNNIGITRATKIALCGTKFATFYHLSPRKIKKKGEIKFYEPLPDFAKLLVDCFIDRACLNAFDPFALIKGARIRRMELEGFTNLLNQCINSRSRDIFDMDIKFPSSLFIDEYFTLLYLFPIVSPRLFKFVPHTLSFSELNAINNDLTVPESCFMHASEPKTWIESVSRFNDMLEDKNIGSLVLSMLTDKLGNARIINCTSKNSQNFCGRRSKYMIPDGYRYNIKSIITKLISWLSEVPILREMIKITNKKSFNHIEFLMLKFEPERIKDVLFNLNDLPKMFSENENKNKNEKLLPPKDKLESLWLPRNLVELINSEMVQDYEISVTAHEKEKIKRSPRKYKTIQRTTLDTLGLASHQHGTNEFSKENNNTNIKTQGSPLKTMGSTRAKSTSPKKHTLLPGQSLVTSFFPSYKHIKEDNPFIETDSQINKLDSLFVKDRYEGKKEIQNNKTSIQYGKLNLEKLLNSSLHYEEPSSNEDMTGSPKRKAPSLAQDISSLQSSPSKRLRIKEKMHLSTDSSPMKQHSIFEPHDGASLVPVQDQGSSSPKTMLETTNNRGMSETRANSVYTALDIIQISDTDSDIDSSSLMEINLSTFQNKS